MLSLYMAVLQKLLLYIRKNLGLKMDPWGNLGFIRHSCKFTLLELHKPVYYWKYRSNAQNIRNSIRLCEEYQHTKLCQNPLQSQVLKVQARHSKYVHINKKTRIIMETRKYTIFHEVIYFTIFLKQFSNNKHKEDLQGGSAQSRILKHAEK